MPDRFDRLEERIDHLELVVDQRFEAIERRFEAIDQRFEAIDRRFEAIDRRFEEIDRRFEAIDQRFDEVNTRIGVLHEEAIGQIRLLAELVRAMGQRMERGFEELAAQIGRTNSNLEFFMRTQAEINSELRRLH